MPDAPDPRPAPQSRGAAPGDVRDLLRREHEATLAEVQRLREERDAQRSLFLLRQVRRAWVIHALAEETVVYRALEGAGSPQADERFVERELVEGLFEKLSRLRSGSQEWRARLNVARDLVALHIEHEHNDLFTRLGRQFDAAQLAEIGQRFELAREKLALLEDAKAA